MQNERILDVFPAADQNQRLVIAVAEQLDGAVCFVLRQETYSGDVGWFVQSRVSIESAQLAGLKAALTCGRTQRLEQQSNPKPTILSFESAAAG